MPTHVPSPALFPPSVTQYSVEFDPQDARGLSAQFPGIPFPSRLAKAIRKRQVEFLAGRFCARQALASCSPGRAYEPIESGSHGEPLWPSGIVGAITHTHGFASVAVARTIDVRALGLDAERFMTREQASQLLRMIALPYEIPMLQEATDWDRSVVLTLVFSVKETIFKALYPEVRRYFGFHDVCVDRLKPDGHFSARLLTTLAPRLTLGRCFQGRFDLSETIVCTALAVDA